MVTFIRGVVFLLLVDSVTAQLPTAIQQIPDLKSLPDSTSELQSQIDSNGSLLLKRQRIRITSPLVFDLSRLGSAKLTSVDGATLIMDGPGPAVKIVGTHQGTASPKSFQPATWNERMPIVSGIEILGAHPEADGIELTRTVAAVVNAVSVRWCRHGIHLVERNRNVVISDCHLYENSGVGVFLDDVNLHQINIGGCHISYNRAGGVVVRDGNVRNIQISGCDIEANMPADETATTIANILLDVSGSATDKTKSIAEVSITGCTIQHSANYSGHEDRTVAPGGANIRIAGKEIYPIDSVTVTGNVLSDTSCNIDLNHVMDVAVCSNNFFAPKPANLTVANSTRVVVNGNTFNPRQFQRPGTIRFIKSHDCIFSNNTLHQFDTADGAVILEDCTGLTLSSLSLTVCGAGIVLRGCRDITLNACRVSRTKAGGMDLKADETNHDLLMSGNAFSGAVSVADSATK